MLRRRLSSLLSNSILIPSLLSKPNPPLQPLRFLQCPNLDSKLNPHVPAFFEGIRAYSLLSLNDLRNKVPRKQKTRKGRGIGSGKGKTAGRGHKGQKARGSGKLGFEGGQTPLRRRLPKRGFKNPFSLTFQVVTTITRLTQAYALASAYELSHTSCYNKWPMLKGVPATVVNLSKKCFVVISTLEESDISVEPKDHISGVLGMEEAYFLWLDRWHPDGILYRVYGHRTVYDAACSLEAKVDSVLKSEEWNWKPEKSEELVIIQSKLNMPYWMACLEGQVVNKIKIGAMGFYRG
uniref:Uncharacterized protein n=1 Tax=Fagus sylvatica TaxID=28930 RepID=A0A2N9HJV0_FAGSY